MAVKVNDDDVRWRWVFMAVAVAVVMAGVMTRDNAHR
jgi:hypothetical protein